MVFYGSLRTHTHTHTCTQTHTCTHTHARARTHTHIHTCTHTHTHTHIHTHTQTHTVNSANNYSILYFCDQIKGNGHLILQDHLGHLMNSSIDDPDWIALKKLLQYLTDTRNVRQKNISVALSIITGNFLHFLFFIFLCRPFLPLLHLFPTASLA